jgi:hypothetical protein
MPSPEEIKESIDHDGSGLRERIVRSVGVHTVALLAISHACEGEELELGGTGTLVAIQNSHFILTAAHVWEKGLGSSRDVGLTLEEDIDHCCRIPAEALVPSGLPRPENWNEWGPDLVFLKLPSAHVGGIEAFRAFYRLDRERASVKRSGIEARVLMGAPWALGKFTRRHAEINIHGLFTDINAQAYRNGDLDYIDLEQDLTLPGVPQNFGGVSGGGLWRVQVFTCPQGGHIDWSYSLEGVAFYESDLSDNKRIIRCHGPEAIDLAMRAAQRG